MKLTNGELKKLKSIRISIEPGEMRSTDNPKEKGMEICKIFKAGKHIKTLTNEEAIEGFVPNIVMPYLRSLITKDE